jgi:hypothetical protein
LQYTFASALLRDLDAGGIFNHLIRAASNYYRFCREQGQKMGNVYESLEQDNLYEEQASLVF